MRGDRKRGGETTHSTGFAQVSNRIYSGTLTLTISTPVEQDTLDNQERSGIVAPMALQHTPNHSGASGPRLHNIHWSYDDIVNSPASPRYSNERDAHAHTKTPRIAWLFARGRADRSGRGVPAEPQSTQPVVERVTSTARAAYRKPRANDCRALAARVPPQPGLALVGDSQERHR